MKPTIFCKTTAQGIHSFYLSTNEGEFFMFSQAYRKGVAEYFGKGVTVDEAIKFSKSKNDAAIIRTMTKIPNSIKYIEQEYDLAILNQTKKRYKTSYRLMFA